MIVRPRPTPFGLLYILRGSILPTIAPRILLVVIASVLVATVHHVAPKPFIDVTVAPFTLLALSIFLGFRNNACYERWWEGRRQWGQLIAESRMLAREFVTILPDDPALRRRCGHRIIAFAHALRCQLRGVEDDSAAPYLGDPRLTGARSKPDLIFLALAGELGALRRDRALSDILYRHLSERMQAITTIQTACERIRSTPTPFTYTLLLHRTAWLFCLLLPFGVVSTLGLYTPVLTATLAYALFGLDALGDELEEPFGRSANALPLDAMVRAIEIAVGEALGEPGLPEPARPRDYILL
jgi:putative membrane protein